MNRYAPHVYVIPEDDADRQIAVGFISQHRVQDARIKVVPEAGGWRNVLKTFQDEYVQTLRAYPHAHVVMLIDFDGYFAERRVEFENTIPDDLKARVFVLGSKGTPETLKRVLNKSFEAIGKALADECDDGSTSLWDHEQLSQNNADRLRLVQAVKPFVF